jgi:RNA polymerase-binding transcription factor DksA
MKRSPSDELVSRMHQRLEGRFRELREIIREELLRSDEERYADLAGRVHDIGDESVADLLADVNLAVIDRHVEEIRDVDAALMRIFAGSYGRCADCSEAIDAARLNAYPTALRCHGCQSRRERTYVQPDHPKL